jgi:hypothetical protein
VFCGLKQQGKVYVEKERIVGETARGRVNIFGGEGGEVASQSSGQMCVRVRVYGG